MDGREVTEQLSGSSAPRPKGPGACVSCLVKGRRLGEAVAEVKDAQDVNWLELNCLFPPDGLLATLYSAIPARVVCIGTVESG